MKKWLLGFSLSLLAVGSFSDNNLSTFKSVNLDRTPFHTVWIDQNAQIDLIDGQNHFELKIPTSILKHNFKVQDGILYFSSPYHEKVKLHVPSLKRIRVTGNATVTSQFLHSSQLTLEAKEDGKILLDGTIVNLNKIINQGKGSIQVLWVDNFNQPLEIYNLCQGTVKLSGNAVKIYTKLSGNSKTSLKQLKVDYAAVKINQQATLDLIVRKHLFVTASGNSVVRYYDPQPLTFSLQLNDNANLLHLREHDIKNHLCSKR